MDGARVLAALARANGFSLHALLIALYVCLYRVCCLFRERWEEHERLAYPLAQLPVILTSPGREKILDRPFFKDGVMWGGLALAVVFNAFHVITAYAPTFPRLERQRDISRIFPKRQCNRLSHVLVWLAPELIGFGYLMPSSVFLLMFSCVGFGFCRVFSTAIGREVSGAL